MQETWVQSLGHKDHLKKEMTTHSSILAMEIPWTEQIIVHGITGSGMTQQLNNVIIYKFVTKLFEYTLVRTSFNISRGEWLVRELRFQSRFPIQVPLLSSFVMLSKLNNLLIQSMELMQMLCTVSSLYCIILYRSLKAKLLAQCPVHRNCSVTVRCQQLLTQELR